MRHEFQTQAAAKWQRRSCPLSSLRLIGVEWRRSKSTHQMRRWISASPLIRCSFSGPATKGTMRPPGASWSPEPRKSPGGRAGCGQRPGRSATSRTCCLWYRWTVQTRRGTPPCSSRRPAVMRTWSGSCCEREPRWTAATTTAGPRWCRLLGGGLIALFSLTHQTSFKNQSILRIPSFPGSRHCKTIIQWFIFVVFLRVVCVWNVCLLHEHFSGNWQIISWSLA